MNLKKQEGIKVTERIEKIRIKMESLGFDRMSSSRTRVSHVRSCESRRKYRKYVGSNNGRWKNKEDLAAEEASFLLPAQSRGHSARLLDVCAIVDK